MKFAAFDALEHSMSEKREKEEKQEVARLRAENARLRELVAWLGPRIERRNANGMPSEQFCILDTLGQPVYRNQPCRHAEIWAIAKSQDEPGNL